MRAMLPRLRLDPCAPPPAATADLFDFVPEAVRLEIGFGGGEHLVARAEAQPSVAFIGVEPFVNGMAKLLRAAEKRALRNIRLYDDDATELLDWLPAGSVDQIDLLYPDPWPKSRHFKRRFVNPANLDRFARIMKPGARFNFASDIESYVNWTLNHCHAHPAFRWEAQGPADWHEPYEGWPGTRYEAKAIREGRRPAYLRFQRKD